MSILPSHSPYNSYCQPSFEPPEGCVCDTITQVAEKGELAGYVEASKVFYGRGAIQLSWNYNYIRASYALTGSANTFCEDPELVAQKPEYAWGSGIYFWMENEKEGSTCHKEALKGDFGGTLNNINGGLECPAYKGGWHADAIKMRLNRYCAAASQLGMTAISSLEGCKGITESYEECLLDGHCPSCEQYAGVDTVTFANTEGVVVSKPKEPDIEPDTTDTDTNARPVPVEEEEEPVETFKPTPAPVVPRPGIALPITTESPTMKEVVQSDSPSSLTSVFIKQSSSPTEPATVAPRPGIPLTSQPTSTPITGEPSPSPVNSPSQEPTSGSPSYAPLTPQPTMGPCDGESCPDEMCRSPYGFCGHGENYCTDKAIWSPECKTNSKPPSPSPTTTVTKTPSSSPVKQATPILNDVFSVTPVPVQLITTEPPVSLDKGSYAKPSGGKGGNPKPSGSSSLPPQSNTGIDNIPVNTNSPTPYPVTPYPTRGQPDTPLPTFKPTNKEWSPTDPEATYFCGLDWADANIACSVRCPSSKSDECPNDQKCFAFTSCAEQEKEKTSSRPTNKPSDQPISNESVTPTPTISTQTNTSPPVSEMPQETDEGSEATFVFQPVAADDIETETETPEDSIKPEGSCEGAPCPFEGECRSQYGFCGVSFIYCNALSSWTLENCGLAGAGVDEKGDFNMLCDVMTETCPTGEKVYRNPADECEYFPCPSEEEDISEITSSAFSIPRMGGKSPTPASLPTLPVPTLPTITKSTPFTLPTVGKPSGMTIGKKSSESSDTPEIVAEEDEEEEEEKDSTAKTPKYSLESFDEWFYSSADSSQTLSLLFSFMIPILTFFAM